MKPEMQWLLAAVVLTFAQMLVAVQGAMMQVGLPMLAGNRENMPAITGWAGRAARAHRNMLESMSLFIPLVILSAVSGRTNALTLLGVQIFFWARLVYAGVYIAGVTWLRTGIWFASVAGLLLIFLQLL